MCSCCGAKMKRKAPADWGLLGCASDHGLRPSIAPLYAQALELARLQREEARVAFEHCCTQMPTNVKVCRAFMCQVWGSRITATARA